MSHSSIAHSRLDPSFRSSPSPSYWRRSAAALFRRWVDRTQQRRYRIAKRRHDVEDLTDRYIDAHGEFRVDEASFVARWQR